MWDRGRILAPFARLQRQQNSAQLRARNLDWNGLLVSAVVHVAILLEPTIQNYGLENTHGTKESQRIHRRQHHRQIATGARDAAREEEVAPTHKPISGPE
jgi:hypothetical protein